VGRLGSAARPLAELGGHSHWVWSARFCPAHDALLLSGSSDALVNLWHVPWMGAAGAAAPPSPSLSSSMGPSREADGGRGKPELAPGTIAASAVRNVASGAAGAGLGVARGGGPRGGARDSRVRAFDDHESSVYSAPLPPCLQQSACLAAAAAAAGRLRPCMLCCMFVAVGVPAASASS